MIFSLLVLISVAVVVFFIFCNNYAELFLTNYQPNFRSLKTHRMNKLSNDALLSYQRVHLRECL